MENTTESPAVEESATEEVTITIQDVGICKQAIEVAATRGAFKADEMAIVGATYNKVSAWLNQMQPAVDNDDAESTDSEETSSDQGETND
jgi:hypothetical protein